MRVRLAGLIRRFPISQMSISYHRRMSSVLLSVNDHTNEEFRGDEKKIRI